MAASSRVRKTSKRTASPAAREGDLDPVPPPQRLTRTSVYKRIPLRVRRRLDHAILLRPERLGTLEMIAREFKLVERYGVSVSALKTYAQRLEEFVRPAVTSQLMAGVLGCLPDGYRRQLLAGSRVLLLSRVIKALAAPPDPPSASSPDASPSEPPQLSVADLAKLASILSSLAGRDSARRGGTGSATPGGRSRHTAEHVDDPIPSDPRQLAETVRAIYGLDWPPQSPG